MKNAPPEMKSWLRPWLGRLGDSFTGLLSVSLFVIGVSWFWLWW